MLRLKDQNLEASLKLKQLKIARLAKRLVPWDDICAEWQSKVAELRKVLMPLGEIVSPLLEGADIHQRRKILDEQLVKILQEAQINN